VPPFDPAAYAGRGAVGLFVPGSGQTASRKGALASLLRGKVEPSSLGEVPSGQPLISLARRPAEVTIYVALPPPGKHANTKRYPVAIVGDGYRGILTSGSTRIRGLVSIADIAPTAKAIDLGRRPVIRSRPGSRHSGRGGGARSCTGSRSTVRWSPVTFSSATRAASCGCARSRGYRRGPAMSSCDGR